MKGKLLSVLFAILLLAIVFSGCTNDSYDNSWQNPLPTDADKIVGTWENYTIVNHTNHVVPRLYNVTTEWTFFENGTLYEYIKRVELLDYNPQINDTISEYWYAFSLADNVLNITRIGNLSSERYDYSFSKGNTILMIAPITGGSTVVYTKQ